MPALPFESKMTYVTPAMAEKWLKKNHPNNRRVSQHRVEALVADIVSNNWKMTHQGICFDNDGNLIDGQHRLLAIVQSEISIWLLVSHNPSGEMNDPIDRHAARSVSYLTGLNTRVISACRVLMGMSQGKPYQNKMSPAQTQAVYENHRADFEKMAGFVGSKKLAGGITAAIIWALPVVEREVEIFARSLVTGEMIKRGDPVYALRAWLAENPRLDSWDYMCATCNCIRHQSNSNQLFKVYTGESGFRAVTTRRRTLKIPNTPERALVESLSWPVDDRKERK